MSLDISITHKKSGDSMDMNWLRNPFGLCNWAEANVHPKTKKDLWYVINHWNYEKSRRINRKLFKEVVDAYWAEIQKLEKGYFYFDLGSYMSFVQPHLSELPVERLFDQDRIKGGVFADDGRYGIPMEYFNKPAFHLSDATLDRYKEWFSQLVEFAQMLQDKDYRFYCSN
jgi:hypothetical protein